jgi:hypothetical protein
MWTLLGLAIPVGGYFAADRVAGFLVALCHASWRDKKEGWG